MSRPMPRKAALANIHFMPITLKAAMGDDGKPVWRVMIDMEDRACNDAKHTLLTNCLWIEPEDFLNGNFEPLVAQINHPEFQCNDFKKHELIAALRNSEKQKALQKDGKGAYLDALMRRYKGSQNLPNIQPYKTPYDWFVTRMLFVNDSMTTVNSGDTKEITEARETAEVCRKLMQEASGFKQKLHDAITHLVPARWQHVNQHAAPQWCVSINLRNRRLHVAFCTDGTHIFIDQGFVKEGTKPIEKGHHDDARKALKHVLTEELIHVADLQLKFSSRPEFRAALATMKDTVDQHTGQNQFASIFIEGLKEKGLIQREKTTAEFLLEYISRPEEALAHMVMLKESLQQELHNQANEKAGWRGLIRSPNISEEAVNQELEKIIGPGMTKLVSCFEKEVDKRFPARVCDLLTKSLPEFPGR